MNADWGTLAALVTPARKASVPCHDGHILMALAHRDGLFTELKLGALDSPDLKFGIGFTWR